MQRTAAARGGECLSASYDASYDQRVKVLWRCGLGHEWAATASSVRSGSWCPVCARRYRGSIDGLKLLAADRGGQLLTTFYEGKRVPLRWSCARGHSFELTSGAAKSGAWCPRCPRDREPPPLREIASSQTGSATARSERQAGPESSGA